MAAEDAGRSLFGAAAAYDPESGAPGAACPPAAKKNILQTIACANRERVAAERAALPQAELEARVRDLAPLEGYPFEQALRAPGMSFICEVKRASPSKGMIAAGADPVAVARDYEAAGAAAVSCLTEPRWFKGSLDDLAAVAAAVKIPVLRKDFVVDEYMIWQARAAGAAAVLLICGILDDDQLADYVALARELGMSALVEAYEPDEVPRALAAGARVVGVNNRDLRTFEVDFGRSIRLRPEAGPGRVFVSESGVETRAHVAALEEAGVDAVLIGETLMRAADKRAMLDELRGGPAKGAAVAGGVLAAADPPAGPVPAVPSAPGAAAPGHVPTKGGLA